jgi:hypothetical protein
MQFLGESLAPPWKHRLPFTKEVIGTRQRKHIEITEIFKLLWKITDEALTCDVVRFITTFGADHKFPVSGRRLAVRLTMVMHDSN